LNTEDDALIDVLRQQQNELRLAYSCWSQYAVRRDPEIQQRGILRENPGVRMALCVSRGGFMDKTIAPVRLREGATEFVKEKVVDTDNSGGCFWSCRKPFWGEVKES
jgi:hypothetical protein